MKILFIGDVMLGRLVNEILKQKPPDYPWGDTLPIFKNTDLRICNLECVISDWGSPWSVTPKVFHFRTDEKNTNVLKKAGINLISLANNHTLDFEYEAMFSMLKILDKAEIKYAGAGANLREASKAATINIKDKKIGLIAFTDDQPEWEATGGKPGIFFVPVDWEDERAEYLFDAIREFKKNKDFLIVSCHWGPNWGYYPLPQHIEFGRALIDAGADIIFGHSAHVVRGIEIYRERPIIYSAGDFIDDYAVDEIERNDQSFIFIIETDLTQIQNLYLYPTVIRDFQASLAQKEEMKEIYLKMQGLCEDLGTTSTWQEKENRLKIEVKQVKL